MSSPMTLSANVRTAAQPFSAEDGRFDKFTSATVATRTLSGFTVTEREYRAGQTLSRHAHPNTLLVYGLEGSYTETCAGSPEKICQPGVLRCLPAGLGHSNVFPDGARCLIIEMERTTLERLGPDAKVLDRPGDVRSLGAPWLANRLYGEFRRFDPPSLISLEGILLEILADAARNCTGSGPRTAVPHWLRQAREYVESNFLHSISLSEIAQIAGVHRVHLAREFRRYFSITVGELLRRRRVEHACRLVSNTQDSLADVAIACGFSDQSHFCATFRQQIGVTPGRFREIVRPQ